VISVPAGDDILAVVDVAATAAAVVG